MASSQSNIPRPRINLSGQRFGHWLVINPESRTKLGCILYRCRCDCGKESLVQQSNLKSGRSTNCGCLKPLPPIIVKHGLSRTKEYSRTAALKCYYAHKDEYNKRGNERRKKLQAENPELVRQWRRDSYHRNNTSSPTTPRPIVPCVFCGKGFKQANDLRKFCSRVCSDAGRELTIGKRISPTNCIVCGEEFKPASSQGKFCSKECHTESVNKQLFGPLVKCAICGSDFRRSSKTTKYCSRKCLLFYVANNRKGIGNLTMTEWNYIKEYFGHRCAYCYSSNSKLTMDHLIPVTRGGRTDADNIVPACNRCNASKNDDSILEFMILRKAIKLGLVDSD